MCVNTHHLTCHLGNLERTNQTNCANKDDVHYIPLYHINIIWYHMISYYIILYHMIAPLGNITIKFPYQIPGARCQDRLFGARGKGVSSWAGLSIEICDQLPDSESSLHMAVCQNLVPLVNIKIAGKWMFIPLKLVLISIDPSPYEILEWFNGIWTGYGWDIPSGNLTVCYWIHGQL